MKNYAHPIIQAGNEFGNDTSQTITSESKYLTLIAQ